MDSHGSPHSSMPSDCQKYDYTHIMTIIWWNYETRNQLPNYSQLSWEWLCVIILKSAFNSTTVIISPFKNYYFEAADCISLSHALNSSLAIFSYLTKKKKKNVGHTKSIICCNCYFCSARGSMVTEKTFSSPCKHSRMNKHSRIKKHCCSRYIAGL